MRRSEHRVPRHAISLGWVLAVFACRGAEPTEKQNMLDAPPHVVAHPLVHRVPVAGGWYSAGCWRVPDRAQPRSDRDLTSSFGMDHEFAYECAQKDPPRRVWVSSFEVDRFLVTNGEYLLCRGAGVCHGPSAEQRSSAGLELNLNPASHEPAQVTFADARAYCVWQGARLPSSAEWQKAARGNDDRIFPWGDEPRDCAPVGYGESPLRQTYWCMPPEGSVGGHPEDRSQYGVEDLWRGDSEEWVADQVGAVWNALPAGKPPRFFATKTNGIGVLTLDWSSALFNWLDPRVIDPRGASFNEMYPEILKRRNSMQVHLKRFAGNAGMIESDAPLSEQATGTFRCARGIDGPRPPVVPQLPSRVSIQPYRESGFAAPRP